MHSKLSFREFMEQVEECLKAYSPDTLQEIIMVWAKKTPSAKRVEFLTMLTPPPSDKKPPAPDEDLLEGINALAERVENGDLCDGWGWDDEFREERDWGDESWVDEADDFFTQAQDALLNSQYKLAEQAYKELFMILAMGEEPGHLPGHPDPTEMLATDLEEALLCYLRAVYMATSTDQRPARLLETIQEHWYLAGSRFSLQKLIDSGSTPLPDFSKFLSDLIAFLQNSGIRHDLLREAVKLSGGIPALAELARREGKKHPKAYVDWLKALEEKKDYQSMVEVAQEGLANVPLNYVVRAEIAEGLIKAGKSLDDIDKELSGYREAFYSNPNLDFFLNLISLAGQKNFLNKEVDAAIARITSLLQKTGNRKDYYNPVDEERITTESSQSLLVTIYILTGRYEQAYNLCMNKEALGWTYGENPKGLVIPFFLVLLAGKMDPHTSPNIEQLWKDAVTVACNNSSIALKERFQQVIDSVFKKIQLSEEDEMKFLKWCIAEAGRRVDAIVGKKYRQSYHKAAKLIVAMAEVLAKREKIMEGAALVKQYYQKYPRHRAFKEELNIATSKSGVY